MNLLRLWGYSLVSCLVAFAWGCVADEPTAALEAPPPPPPPSRKAEATYDYSHTVKPRSRAAVARRMVIALVRFEEDRAFDDDRVPFGPGPVTQPAVAPDSTVVEVQVQTGGIHTEGPMVTAKPGEMGLRTRSILKHELLESENFVVVERDRIIDILREQRFGQTGYVYPVGTPESGKLMGVQYLLDGSIGLNEDLTFKNTMEAPPDYKETDQSLFDRMFSSSRGSMEKRMRALREKQKRWVQAQSTLETNPWGAYLNLYSAKTGELVVDAYGIGATRLLAVRDAVDDLVDKCRDLSNPPTIVALDGERVIIDTGAIDGVQVGKRFRYVTPGKSVYNSAGQAIGSLEDEGGELEVTSVQELMSITKVTRVVSAPAIGGRVEPLE